MVELNFDRVRPEAILNLNEVGELRGWSRQDGAVRIGSGLTYAEAMRGELAAQGLDIGPSCTQIVPLVVGDARTALRMCEAALTRGVFAQAIRPPTVPSGTARLRVSLSAAHTDDDVDRLLDALGACAT